MGDLNALKAIWPTLSGITADKLAALNAMQVAGPPQDVLVTTVQSFMTANSLQDPVAAYAARGASAVQRALIACNYLIAILSASDPTIHTSIPANFAAIEQLGPGLLADPATGVTPELLAEMMALITPPTPWWQANGFSTAVTITDLIAAGNLF